MRKLLNRPRAVAGLSMRHIDADAPFHEHAPGHFHLNVLERGNAGRLQAEEFITRAYRQAFGAELRSFYPSVIALRDGRDDLLGAAGARCAGGQRLFLEQYLISPIEKLISGQVNFDVQRTGVVELGNFAIARPALTYPFMEVIGAWLQTYEVEWIVFALTRSLRRLFQRANVALLDLGPAEPSRLVRSANQWGSYFNHEPRVMAANLGNNLASFRRYRKVAAPPPTVRKNIECRI